jgi:hypothetical protein
MVATLETDRLQTQFDEHIYQLRTIQFWIAEARLGCQDLHNEIRVGRPPLDDLDMKILAMLDKSPFQVVHSIAKRLSVTHTIMLLHLHNSISFKSFHLHWVAHLLTDD